MQVIKMVSRSAAFLKLCLLSGLLSHAHPSTCPSSEFSCGTDVCVPGTWRCDGEDDCVDGRDEANCDSNPSTCPSSTFSCGTDVCVPGTWRCDGEDDCVDGRDEANCDSNVPSITTSTDDACDQGSTPCHSGNNQCIRNEFWCNGVADCTDGSDESNCTESRVCPPMETLCADGNGCFNQRWRCDGDYDCDDGSDEGPGCMHTCPPNQTICPDMDQCMPNSWLCDGETDCSDGRDEKDCGTARTCSPNTFKCSIETGIRCVPSTWVCDSEIDCPGGDDEENCSSGTSLKRLLRGGVPLENSNS